MTTGRWQTIPAIQLLINEDVIVNDFPNITHMLKKIFNVEDGLSEDVAIRLYCRAAASGGNLEALKNELNIAFSDESMPWRAMLANDDYEVFDAENENAAREYAKRILWTPIFGA